MASNYPANKFNRKKYFKSAEILTETVLAKWQNDYFCRPFFGEVGEWLKPVVC